VKKIVLAVAMVAAAFGAQGRANAQVKWTRNGAPTETTITGGPWTLEQSGAANGLKSSGYCDASGKQIGNPGTERMEPYYFPEVFGFGRHLQGYFDYRPKDTDEGVVAASSDDAGLSWNFQQKVLELRTTCPNQVNKEPDGENEKTPDPNNSDNGDDDGEGHQFVISINGHTYLYTLARSVGHIDSDQLYIHELNPLPGQPLNGAPAFSDAATDPGDAGPLEPIDNFRTTGLLNPDGILGVVPGVSPLTIIYEQKILGGDNTAPTAFPTAQQCIDKWAGFYANNPFGTAPNDDITFLRLASTTDGINFKDLGPLQGLNDPTSVSIEGTRWVATAGTIFKLRSGRYGLFFSGGNCVDGDSDSFHYIGYAESADLVHWTVVNGLNNPIASTFPTTMAVDPATGTPLTGGTLVTIPSQTAVVGNTLGFFAGRVYAPSAPLAGERDVNVFFAGYHTQKPKNGLGDYRTIGRVGLHSSEDILASSQSPNGRDDDRDDRDDFDNAR
jgi:hypothetical protein